MKRLIFLSLAMISLPSVVHGQSNVPVQEADENSSITFREFLLLDTDSFSFPPEARDDLSQCEGKSITAMARAVQHCWAVYDSFRKTKAFRMARADYTAVVNDSETDLERLDEAKAELFKQALLVRQLMPEPRYPAQLQLAILAHLARFQEFSRTRQFQRALDDSNETIAAVHRGKDYVETGLHNLVLHYNRIEMNLALDRPAADAFIDQSEYQRPIRFSDFKFIYEGAFYDKSQNPPDIMQVGVDPNRVIGPTDCQGRNFSGLVRAIRFCEPVLQLYEEARGFADFAIKSKPFDHIAAKRILLRAEKIDAPAADFFKLAALFFQSSAAYAADDEARGADRRARALQMLEQSKLDWDDEIVDVVEQLPELVEAALAREAKLLEEKARD